MSLDLNSIADYIKENEAQLAAAAIFSAKTAALIETQGNVQVGIKSSEQINILTTDAYLQTGGNCGFNPIGLTQFTQRELEVGKIKVNESICPKAFEAKYTQKALKEGSTYDYMAYATEYSEQKGKRIGAALEVGIWQGDRMEMNLQLNKFDGLLKIATQAGYVNGNISNLGALTTANVIQAVDDTYQAIPVALLDKDNVFIACGADTFRKYVVALRDSNLYHYPVDGVNMELVIPATNIKLIGLNGLNGTGKLFASHWSNIYLGCDMLNEQDRFELFYAKEADEMRFVSEFKLGVQIAFPQEVVLWIPN